MNNSQKKNSAIYITRKEVRLINERATRENCAFSLLFHLPYETSSGFSTPDLIFSLNFSSRSILPASLLRKDTVIEPLLFERVTCTCQRYLACIVS